jgi:transcriptional regulator with XRE-family HTH domain
MNFSQLQDRVRLELLRRIERGTLSVSLLARQTGLGQPHISNFLHKRRGLSLKALDKILEVQRLQVVDLLPARRAPREELKREREEEVEAIVEVPLVNHAVAIFDPYIRASSTLAMAPFSGDTVKGLEERCSSARRQWDRFVVVRIGAEDARAMEPVLQAEALVLLDRHYTSFHPYQEGETNLYGARVESRLLVRYAQFQGERVVLRAHQARVKAEVLEPGPGETGNDLLVGRVVLVVNPH